MFCYLPNSSTYFLIVPKKYKYGRNTTKNYSYKVPMSHSPIISTLSRKNTMPIIKFISLAVLIWCLTVADNIAIASVVLWNP